VYTVTPISSADISGIRATSDSIVPTTTTSTSGTTGTTGTTTSPASTARIEASLVGAADVGIRWAGTGGYMRYYLRHVVNDVPMTPTALSEISLVERNVAPGRHRYDLMGSTFGTGTGSVIASSAVVTVAASTTGTTGTTTTSTTAPPSGTTVTVPAAPGVALRVGATMSLGAGQWTSLTPTIASVGADGTVTGLAAGTAQISALAVQSDGSVRVTVVRVAVQP
jgi:hypothetical protein